MSTASTVLESRALTSAVVQPPQVEIAKCAEALCALVPDVVHLQMSSLVVALHGNLGHQRSPVRLHSMTAIATLLCHGAEGLEKVFRDVALEDMRALGYDRTASVRVELAKVLGRLLVRLPARGTFDSALVALLLSRVADENPDARAMALSELYAAAEALSTDSAGVGAGAGAGTWRVERCCRVYGSVGPLDRLCLSPLAQAPWHTRPLRDP
jgi:hypothetical protein